MSNKEFEKLVLEKLSNIEGDVLELKSDVGTLKGEFGELKGEVSGLRKEMHDGFDRLENIINEQTGELTETINNQGRYINQAFDVISSMQNERVMNNKSKKFAVI